MVNWDLVSIVVFYGLLLLVYFRFKKKFETHGIVVMYKAQWGIKLMDRLAKPFPRFLNFISRVGVFVGFAGMAFIFYFLTKETLKLIFIAGTQPALAPVLPGVQIAGAPVLSFWHWIITIFVAAVIHEFSHGVVARLYNVKVKSSGFAFLGPLLAAFVEPEEKELEKKTKMQQLAVFAAGPFSNLVLGGFIFLILMFMVAPFVSQIYDTQGIIVHQTLDGYPVNESGIEVPFTLLAMNGEETLGFDSFVSVTDNIMPGDTVVLSTDKGEYTLVPVANPDNASKAFFGVSGFEEKVVLKDNYSFLAPFTGFIDWVKLLLVWLFLISVGVGLFNLLPLGPVDGGRMFYTLSLAVFKKESHAKKSLWIATIFCVSLIFINMIPWLEKLFFWLLGIFSSFLV